MTYEFADDRLVNMLEYYIETNPEAELNDLVEFIRKNTANLKEELYIIKSLLNDMKYFKLEYLKDFHALDIETKTNNLNQLKGMYYKQESLDKFLASNNTENEKLDLMNDFFVKLYTDNIDYLELEIESIKLTIESSDYPFGSEQEATPETAKQPKKRKYKTNKIKADNLKKLNLLKTAMIKTAPDRDGNRLKLTNLPRKEYQSYYRAFIYCQTKADMFQDMQLQNLTYDIVIEEIEKNK